MVGEGPLKLLWAAMRTLTPLESMKVTPLRSSTVRGGVAPL